MIYSSLQDPAMFVFLAVKKGLIAKATSPFLFVTRTRFSRRSLNLFTNITHPCLPHGGMNRAPGLTPELAGWNFSNYLIICIFDFDCPGFKPRAINGFIIN